MGARRDGGEPPPARRAPEGLAGELGVAPLEKVLEGRCPDGLGFFTSRDARAECSAGASVLRAFVHVRVCVFSTLTQTV